MLRTGYRDLPISAEITSLSGEKDKEEAKEELV